MVLGAVWIAVFSVWGYFAFFSSDVGQRITSGKQIVDHILKHLPTQIDPQELQPSITFLRSKAVLDSLDEYLQKEDVRDVSGDWVRRLGTPSVILAMKNAQGKTTHLDLWPCDCYTHDSTAHCIHD